MILLRVTLLMAFIILFQDVMKKLEEKRQAREVIYYEKKSKLAVSAKYSSDVIMLLNIECILLPFLTCTKLPLVIALGLNSFLFLFLSV